MDSKCFRKILDCLGLTCTSGAFWRTSIIEVNRTHKCPVATISERRYNQSRGISQVFVTIVDACVYHSDNNIASGCSFKWNILEIVSELGSPKEITDACFIFLKQFLYDVFVVNIDDNQSLQSHSFEDIQIGTHKIDNASELLSESIEMISN